MIPRYSRYEESDISLLRLFPANWEIVKLRHIFQLVSIKGRPDLPLLSVTREHGVIKRDTSYRDGNHNYIPDDLNNYKVVKCGQFVVNKMKAWQGSYGISRYDGIVSPAYYVFIIKIGVGEFIHRALRSIYYIPYFIQSSDGIRTDQWDLNLSRMKNIPLALPSIEEQLHIVQYIDYKNHQINKYISIKKKQIELLKELKQTIINDAVTGKIDVHTGKPYPKYKDSGVDWLGMIPEEWEPQTIGKLVSFNPSKNEIKDAVNEESLCTFIPMEKLSVDGVIDCFEKRPYREVKNGFTYFRKHDLIIAKITPCFENAKSAWLSELDADFGFGTTELIVMRVSTNRIHGKLLRYIVASPSFLRAGKKFMRGAAGQQRVPVSFIKDYSIALPPIQVQSQILEYISSTDKNITTMIESNLREISLLNEFQTRLISDVVTGKLDVRDFQALPSTVKANKPFIRSVLAADIIDRMHKEPTFGHVKLQKTLFLCAHRCGLDIGAHYHRAAAGPHDGRAIRSIDSQLQRQKWFLPIKRDKRYLYEPMEKAGMHKQYYMKYFSSKHSEIDRIINLLMKLNTERCEMIATIFSAWEDLLKKDYPISENDIIDEVLYHWNESKKRIPIIRWRKCLAWMKANHLVPILSRRENAD